MIDTREALYEFELAAVPAAEWRAAFLRPPPRLTSARYMPDIGRVGLTGATGHFRTTPERARFWLKRIDRWIAYANSVVEE
jgi:hypothetical protein